MASNTNAELCQSKDGLVGSDEGTGSLVPILCDELRKVSENAKKVTNSEVDSVFFKSGSLY